MRTLLLLFALTATAACGLADDSREEDKKHTYIKFTDSAFEQYCLETFDGSGDGRVSVYEAERVLEIDCSGRGIASLSDLSYFTRVRRLDCSDNALADLDCRAQRELERLDCSQNRLVVLDVEGLRSLVRLDCSSNRLASLGVGSNTSLAALLCGMNALVTLDVSRCALTMSELFARNNPRLTTVYLRAGQSVSSRELDPQTEVVVY